MQRVNKDAIYCYYHIICLRYVRKIGHLLEYSRSDEFELKAKGQKINAFRASGIFLRFRFSGS